MLKKIYFTLLPVLALTFCHHAVATSAIEKLQQYYESGNYFKEIQSQLTQAQEYLEQRMKSGDKLKLAIVFDIDDTALSNYHDLSRMDFTYNLQALTATMMLARKPAIPAVLEFYTQAKEKGIHLFFISERPNTPEMLAATVKNLNNAGFEGWDQIILKPINNPLSNPIFKAKARQQLSYQDFDIVLNISDEINDLNGGYAETKIKLPNPFYSMNNVKK